MPSRFLKSARLISALTLASRVLGLVRDMVCSYAFGVKGVWSAFSMAFQIPNLFRRLFGEGALSAASIPVMTNTLTHQGKDAVDALAGRLVGLLVVVLAIICLLGEVIVAGLYWYYQDNSDTTLVMALTALMLPYMILICTVAILGALQNVFGRFASPALMPILLNIFMIAAALAARSWIPEDKRTGVVLLAASVMASGIVQLAWQWLAARRCGLRLALRLDTRDPAIRRIALTMVPVVAGLGAVQINTLLDALIAWWFVAEQVTPGADPERVGPGILYYAQRLYQFPLGVFAIALATAIFPTLSRHATDGDLPGLGQTLVRGVRVTTFLALPCLVGLILVREPMVVVLLERGEFAEWSEATRRVAMAMSLYSLGIWAYAVNQLVVRAFYAVHDAKTPLQVAVVMIFLNVALNLLLVQTSLKEGGLALATSICAAIQVVALLRMLHRRVGRLVWSEAITSMLRTLAATALMGLAVYGVDRYVAAELAPSIRLAVLLVTGAASFAASAWIVRSTELRELLQR